MLAIRHPLHRDRLHRSLVPPIHASVAACPRCNALIPEDDAGAEVDCPACGQAVRYQALEDRLMSMTDAIREGTAWIRELQAKVQALERAARERDGAPA